MEPFGMPRTRSLAPLLVFAVAAFAACRGEPSEEDPATDAAEDVAAGQRALPDTTAASLWSYLQEVGYSESWKLWPGKGELYPGTEPHGMLLSTYLNGPASDAVTGSAGTLPDGAIVVKENYRPDSTLAAVTVMYKRQGYAPEHGDWFWAKFLPDGTVDAGGKAAGRVQGCIGCHGQASDNDYIMTATLAGDARSGS